MEDNDKHVFFCIIALLFAILISISVYEYCKLSNNYNLEKEYIKNGYNFKYDNLGRKTWTKE